MSNGNNTHIQELLPAIPAMVERGMTQQENAECYGFKNKRAAKKLL